jgi:hypothetical protein
MIADMLQRTESKNAGLRTVKSTGITGNTGEDAVSEAIGYILIFTITVIGIAMITVCAYPILLQSQNHADEISAEQTLVTLRNDIGALTFGNVPYRETTVRIAGGSLELIPAADSADKFVLEYQQSSGGVVTRDFKTGELRYSGNAVTGAGTAVLSLENGAVLKREKGAAGSVMTAEPRWYFDAGDGETCGTLVIIMTKLEGERRYSSGGIRDVRLSMTTAPEIADEDYMTAQDGHTALGAQTIVLEYIPDRDNDLSKGWENYLTGGIANGINGGGFKKSGTKYVFGNVGRLVVKTYTITVEDI